MTTGAVILAGGKSSRMNGTDKALLNWNGMSFLDRLFHELRDFDERLLSADRADRYPQYAAVTVPDLFPGAGPMGGLYSALSACRSEALLVTACDTPLFSGELGAFLCSYLSCEWDAVVVRDRAGRLHPLCGVYRRSAAPVLLELLRSGDLKMRHLLDRLRVKEVSLAWSAFPDDCLLNINRPEDHRRLLDLLRRPAVIAVSGLKNAGKTTLIEKLIPRLRAKGFRVAVIKHDGHDFVPDVPGTDSFRFQQAGAEGTAVFSASRYLVTRQAENTAPETLFSHFQDMDIILLEGLKDSPYPKLEIIRAPGAQSVCRRETLLAVLTRTAPVEGVPRLDPDDADGAAECIIRYVQAQNRL